MTDTPLKSLFLALLALVAVGCGDPGTDTFDEEANVEDGPEGEELGFSDDPELEAFRGDEDDAGTDNRDLVKEIASGELVIEQIGEGERVFDEGLTEAAGSLRDGRISIDLTRVAIGGGVQSSSESCNQGLVLEIANRTLSAKGECGFVTYVFDATLGDDGVVEGEITIQHEGTFLEMAVHGLREGNQLLAVFEHDTLFPPGFRDFWEGELVAELP